MKITIESTGTVVPFEELRGDHARVWRGVTEGGVPCLVLVAMLANETDESRAAMEPELATLQGRGGEVLALVTYPPAGAAS